MIFTSDTFPSPFPMMATFIAPDESDFLVLPVLGFYTAADGEHAYQPMVPKTAPCEAVVLADTGEIAGWTIGGGYTMSDLTLDNISVEDAERLAAQMPDGE